MGRACRRAPSAADADFAVAVRHGLEALEVTDTVVAPASYLLDESRAGPVAAAAGRGSGGA
ncbi:hypothetical protein GCM10023088_68320 [Actinomadura verrucosospora]